VEQCVAECCSIAVSKICSVTVSTGLQRIAFQYIAVCCCLYCPAVCCSTNIFCDAVCSSLYCLKVQARHGTPPTAEHCNTQNAEWVLKSGLLCVAVCCVALQVKCLVLQCVALSTVLQCVAVSTVLQCVAVCTVLQCVAVSTALQRLADSSERRLPHTHNNTLQRTTTHTPTHCNIPGSQAT